MIKYLKAMVSNNASDLFFSAGAAVNIKIEGDTRPLSAAVLANGEVKELVYPYLSAEQKAEFESSLELNFALDIDDVGRFRVNLYRQRGEVAMVVRHIKDKVPTLEELHLPASLAELVMSRRGLVLVVGATGSGKSTALAAMIKHRSENSHGHILTIEEPVEFIHPHAKSIVDQREVGTDTLSYASALKNAMREAPDVIMIGEIRDRETMQSAIAYSETGHLCLSTLHANNASQSLDRIINFFPESAHKQLLADLSLNLQGIVSLRLLRGIDGKRIAAYEILRKSAYITELIQNRDIDGINSAMERGMVEGMVTFDQCILEFYRQGKISKSEALENADSKNNVRMQIKLASKVVDNDAASSLSMLE